MTTVFACIKSQDCRLSEEDFSAVVEACAAQMADDFAPAWERRPAAVITWPAPKMLPDDDARMRFILCTFRNAQPDDPPGALAYHWVDPKSGRALVVVLVDRILAGGGGRDAVCAATGHEIIETEGDEYANTWSDRGDGMEELHELCDRVQNTTYTKKFKLSSGATVTIQVTNFLLPPAFNNFAPPGSKFDYCGRLSYAREVASGGYAIVRPIGGGAAAVYGDARAARGFSSKALECHGVMC